jgi:uncharacterized membrane protein YccC
MKRRRLPELPNARETIFSLKSYAAALLALYIAYSIGLPRPFWAMTTVYVVSQPWSGAVRSKALYRLLGTYFGAVATVFMVPRLAQAPVLMTLAMALWVGVCLYIAVLDRTPRSYLFMLAGYTAALIGFPSVSDPATVFDTAVARVEEIGLGIVCATLVHSLVLPRDLAPTLILRIDTALQDARVWMADTLRGAQPEERDKERRALANDITQLRLLTTHLPFDTSNLRWTTQAVHAMQDQLAALTPVVSSIEDRLRALQMDVGRLPEEIAACLAEIAAWIETPAADPAVALRLRATLQLRTPRIGPQTDWDWRTALLASLSTRLRELIDAHAACLALRRDIDRGLRGEPVRQPRRFATGAVLHTDRGLALLSALAASVAIAVCVAFWIGTAWTNGATAALMAAIFSCLYSPLDNPVPGIMQFLTYTIYSIPVSALYLLGILPAVHSFEMLALTILPTVFVLGVFIARPATAGQAMAFVFGFLGTLALHDTNTADLVSFLDGQIAQNFGVGMAAVIAAILRSVNVDWSARRIQAANWKDLAALCEAVRPPAWHSYAARMLDRVGLLQARLAQLKTPLGHVASDALKDLRVGRDLAELQRVRRHLPEADAAIRPVLASAAHFFRRRAEGEPAPVPEPLRVQLDDALRKVAAAPGRAVAREHAVVALVGLRRAFFPEAGDLRAEVPA